MGNFIAALKEHLVIKPQQQFFRRYSLSKLREYHALFKSRCDTCSIDDTEFNNIFGETHSKGVFDLLDDDHNLLIDGLQLFAGMILFSENTLNMEDKVKFLFDLFDFNDLNSLSITDIQFLMYSCCSAIQKIRGFKYTHNKELLRPITKNFSSNDSRINISDAIRTFCQNPDVRSLFEILNKNTKPRLLKLSSEKLYNNIMILSEEIEDDQLLISKKSEPGGNAESRLQSLCQVFQDPDVLASKKQEQSKHESKPFANSHLKVGVNWVYGIRFLDVRENMAAGILGDREILVYFTGCVVVILYTQIRRQSHYNKHRHEVICVDMLGDLVATAQRASIPEVHIWSARTLETKLVIKGVHRKGVHMVKICADGQSVVTCGLQIKSPILVYCLKTGELIYSTLVSSPVVDLILERSLVWRPDQQVSRSIHFLAATQNQVFEFKEAIDKKGQITKNLILNIEESQRFSAQKIFPITCVLALKVNKNNKYLRAYEAEANQNSVLYTGHQNGEFIQWIGRSPNSLKKYSSELVKILYFQQSILVATHSSHIEIWSLQSKFLRSIDLTNLGIKMINYEVANITLFRQSLIVLSTMGDAIKIIPNPKKCRADRIHHIIKLDGQNLTAVILHSDADSTFEDLVYVGGQGGILKTISMRDHCMVDRWTIGQPITAIDCFIQASEESGITVAVGTESGRILIKVDLQEMDKNLRCDKGICDLKLVKSKPGGIVACCQDKQIYYFQEKHNEYSLAMKVPIGLTIPRSIHEMTNHSYLICSSDNKLYTFIIGSDKCTLINQYKYRTYEQRILTKYMLTSDAKKRSLPIVISPKIIAMAGEDGGLIYWRNSSAVFNHSKYFLGEHLSRVSSIVIEKTLRNMLTCGQYDQTIVSYQLKFVEQKNVLSGLSHPEKYSLGDLYYNSCDELIQRQVRYSLSDDSVTAIKRDHNLLVRGIKNGGLAKTLGKTINNTDSTFSIEQQQAPPVNLQLEYIFGIETFHKRNTLLYGSQPAKRLIYFVSRYVVVYDPAMNQQRFYTSHRYKITAICPVQEDMIASGENSQYPNIHLWNHRTLQTIRIIPTGHLSGILHLAYSNSYILSAGADRQKSSEDSQQTYTFSIQLSNTVSSEEVSFARVGQETIYFMAIKPGRDRQHVSFVTSTDGGVSFWILTPYGLIKQKICSTEGDSVSALAFKEYCVRGNKEFDLVVGTVTGGLGVITERPLRYVMMRENAHSKFINNVNLLDSLIITSSEDQTIKIWNRYFQEVFVQEIHKIDFFRDLDKLNSEKKYFEKGSTQRKLSIQSISVWNSSDQNSLVLLLGTRNGEVFQANLDLQSKEYKYTLYLRNHCCQSDSQKHQKVFYTHHPFLPIMATTGDDQNLFIWDNEQNRLLTSKILGYVSFPSAIKFSPNGDLLVIGFCDGLLIFLDSKIISTNSGKSDQNRYIVPTLALIQKTKLTDRKAAVLTIQFSDAGEHLAVSFNNSYNQKSKNINNQQSFVSLFAKSKEKTKGIARNSVDKIYELITDIRCTQSEKGYQTSSGNFYGMASCFMTFGKSQQDGKLLLLIYYQIVDSNQVRLNEVSESEFKIWDLLDQTTVVSAQFIDIEWKKIDIPNQVYCTYNLLEDMSQRSAKANFKAQKMLREDQHVAYITSMSLMNMDRKNKGVVVLLGSLLGDIHTVRLESLSYSEIFMKNPNSKEMFLGRSQPAHTSFINQLQIHPSGKYLLSTALTDQSVMKWRINFEPQAPFIKFQSDIYGDLPHSIQFSQMLSKYKQRETVSTVKMDTKASLQRQQSQKQLVARDGLSMYRLIGRSANNLKNNIRCIDDNSLIYVSGRNILLLKENNQEQEFIYSDEGTFNNGDPITAICTNTKKTVLLTASSGLVSTVNVWNISSQILLHSIDLPMIVYSHILRLSTSGNQLIVYGLNADEEGILVLVHIPSKQIINQTKLCFDVPWRIKDIRFLNDTFESFVSCGIKHLRLWQLQGQQFTFRNLELEEKHNSSAIYLCLLSFNEGCLIGTESGFLIFTKLDQKCDQYEAHTKSCVYLASIESQVVSGGNDNTIILWGFSYGKLFKTKTFKFDPTIDCFSSLDTVMLQSLSITNTRIVYGLKNGSLFEIPLQKQNKSHNAHQEQKNIFTFHDGEPVAGLFFSLKPPAINVDEYDPNRISQPLTPKQQLYEITVDGLLSIWQFEPLCLIHQKKLFENRPMNIIDAIESSKQTYFVIDTNQIIAFNKPSSMIPGFSKKVLSKILSACLSQNGKILAIGVQSSVHHGSVTLYDITNNTFQEMQTIKSSFLPNYIQFSSTHTCIYMTDGKEQSLTDIQRLSAVTGFDWTQWSGLSLANSPKFSSTTKWINNQTDNSVLSILKLNDSNFLYSDRIGTIRLCRIEEVQEEQGQGDVAKIQWVKYAHLNDVRKMVLSKNRSIVATTSDTDMSIILWKINMNALNV